jgi:hypothetical protein
LAAAAPADAATPCTTLFCAAALAAVAIALAALIGCIVARVRAGWVLGDRAIGIAEQIGDHILAATLGEPLESPGVFPFDADQDDQPRPAVAGVVLDVARMERGQIAVEVAGLGIWVCPGIYAHRLVSRILRNVIEAPSGAWADMHSA